MMFRPCHRSIAAAAVVLVMSHPAHAQRTVNLPDIPPEPTTLTIAPAIVVDALRASYTTTEIAQHVDVTLRLRGVQRTESYTLRTSPGAFELDLGKLLIWSQGDQLLAVHTANTKDVLQLPVEGGVLATLQKLAPPVPAPTLELALGTDAAFARPTAYTPGVAWKSAEIDQSGQSPALRVRGASDEAVVEMVTDAEGSRLKSMTVRIDRDELDLRLTLTPATVERGPSYGVDISGRRVVTRLEDLVPRSDELRAGDELPDLALRFAITPDESEPIAPLRGPAVLVFFRVLTPGVQSALAAAAELSASAAEGQRPSVIAVSVQPRETPATPAILADLRTTLAPAGLAWTPSPATTIDRFARGTMAVAVAVGADNRIRGVVIIDDRHADEVKADLATLMK